MSGAGKGKRRVILWDAGRVLQELDGVCPPTACWIVTPQTLATDLTATGQRGEPGLVEDSNTEFFRLIAL